MRERLIEAFKRVCSVCLRLQSTSLGLNIHLNRGRVLTLYNQQARRPLEWSVIHHTSVQGKPVVLCFRKALIGVQFVRLFCMYSEKNAVFVFKFILVEMSSNWPRMYLA